MALKKVHPGDLVAIRDPYSKTTFKCVITQIMIHGTSGKMAYLHDGTPQSLYFEKSDLKNMRRLKVSQVPKKLAEMSRDRKKNMKLLPLLKTLVLCVALVAMTACSAQKRAERHIRKAVALCPELVQVKAHPIDTALTVPGFADMVAIPFRKVATGDTLYAATDHGTVVVSLRQSDSALRVGFVAAPQKIRYRDTLRYEQVTVEERPRSRVGQGGFAEVLLWICGIGAGMILCHWLARTAIKPNK